MKKNILPLDFTEQFSRLRLSSVFYSIFLLLLSTNASTLIASGRPEKDEQGKKNFLVPGNLAKRTDKIVFLSPTPCEPFADITPLGSLVFCDSSPLELQACNQYTFSNTLSGQEVVTPVNTTASGTVTGVFNSFNNLLELSVSFQGFQTLTIAAHLHISSPGTNGLIIEDLAPEFSAGVTSGQFTKTITLSASEATALLGGNIYIDIHSQNAPAGEIRAQLTPALDCSGFSFLWNTGETTSSIFVNTSGTYEVFVTNSNGCEDSAEVTVTADPAALIDAGPDQTICATDTIYLDATLSGVATNMVWQKNAAFGDFIDPDTNPQTRYVLNATGRQLSSISFGAMTNDPGSNVCQGGLDTVVIFINPAAIANAGSDRSLCQTATTIFPLDGSISGVATTATWSGGSGIFQPDANTLNAVYVPSAAELAAADDLILTLTTDDPAGLCAAGTDQMLFRIDSAAIVDAGPDQNICVGDTIYLNATLSGVATNMVWQKNAAFGNFIDPDTDPQTRFVLNATGQALSSIRFGAMTNDPGSNVCQGGLDTVEIFINPAAIANAGSDIFLCQTSSTIFPLNGSISGIATTATWSGGSGTFQPDANTLNAVYVPSAAELAAAADIILTLTADGPGAQCASGTDEMLFRIDSAAIVDAGPDQNICVGDTIYLNATLSGVATNMVWQKNAAFGNFIDPDTDPQTRFVLNATGQALSSIRFGAMTNDPGGNVCQGGLDTVEIFINPAATANAGSDISLCQTSSFIFPLNGSISGIATTATWSGGSGNFQPDANTLNAVYVPSAAELAAAADIILTLTANGPGAQCASGTDEMLFRIDSAALVDAGPDQTICATDTIYLNATLSGVATNMVWQKNAAFGTFIDPDTDPQTRFVLNATGQALSSIRFGAMTNDPGGNVCQGGLDTVEIFINPAAIANAGSDISLCQTSSFVFPLNGSISGIATTATWSGGSGIFQPDANTLNAVYVPTAAELAAADDLILTLTTDDPAGLCAAGTDQMLFRIDSAAIVDAGPDQNICVGDTIYLNATLSGVATNMVWQKNAAFGNFIDPDTDPQTRFVLNATGQALSSIRFGAMTNDPGSNVCQGGLDTVEIFINQPISSVSIQQSDFNGYSISCNGADDGSATAIISGGIGPYTYLWSNGEQTETISNLSPGTYTVTVSGSCEGELSASVSIIEPPALTIIAEPISNFNGFNVSCFKGSDGEARAVATGGTGPISYIWSNGVANDTVTGLSAGLHTVTVTDLNGCVETSTVTLTEPSMLQVEAGSNRTIYRGYPDSSCTTIQAVATGGTAPYTILWSNGSTSPTITSCAVRSKTFYVTVTDANNCVHTDSVRICVIDVRCGTGRDKVRMCHATNSPTNPFRTICTSISAASWHLNTHSGDLLGRCGISHDCDWPQSSRYDDVIAGDELEGSEKMMLGAVPNPFSVQTTIRFSTGGDDFVKVWVSDITGRNIQTLYEGESESDIVYEAIFDGSSFNEGMYFIRISTASGEHMVSKMMLIK